MSFRISARRDRSSGGDRCRPRPHERGIPRGVGGFVCRRDPAVDGGLSRSDDHGAAPRSLQRPSSGAALPRQRCRNAGNHRQRAIRPHRRHRALRRARAAEADRSDDAPEPGVAAAGGRIPHDPTSARRWPRKRAELPATVLSGSARVVELSYGGVRLELPRPPGPGRTPIEIKLPDLRRVGAGRGLLVAARRRRRLVALRRRSRANRLGRDPHLALDRRLPELSKGDQEIQEIRRTIILTSEPLLISCPS